MIGMKMNMRKTAFAAVTGLSLATLSAVPAFAISNTQECVAAVTKANQDLLKATVSNEQLTEIYAAISEADAACLADDFAKAEAALATANEKIAAAGAN